MRPGPRKKFLIGPIEAFEYDYNVHLFKRIAPTAEWGGKRASQLLLLSCESIGVIGNAEGSAQPKTGGVLVPTKGVDQ